MFQEDVGLVKTIAREIAREEIAKALAQHQHEALPKQVAVAAAAPEPEKAPAKKLSQKL